MILYGLPKVGKTEALVGLDDCLILDFEEGSNVYESLRILIKSIEALDFVINEFAEYANKLLAEGKKVTYKYRRIAIDTVDKMEAFCEVAATAYYKKTPMGKEFEGDSVVQLPKGAGYFYLRQALFDRIDALSRVCETLILVSHTKDKILDKGGVEVVSNEISLTGKISAMLCSKADVIGYLYREDGKPLMVNFATNENQRMGSRFKRLAGQNIEFDWSKIFIEKEVQKSEA